MAEEISLKFSVSGVLLLLYISLPAKNAQLTYFLLDVCPPSDPQRCLNIKTIWGQHAKASRLIPAGWSDVQLDMLSVQVKLE